MNNSNFTIITFYEFKKNHNSDVLKEEIKSFCLFNKIRGTMIIAHEGINGTLAGFANAIHDFVILMNDKGFSNLELKYSYSKYMPFNRLKVKIKKEIVTFRSNIVDPENIKGKHIDVKKWNQLIKEKKSLVIDVRNNFEFKMGTFEGAINPQTKSFTEFKNFIDKDLKEFKNTKIAIFCTGGIRCEKASSYMLKRGFKDINQLKGGIIKYLEEIPKKNSTWIGECFVFDNRVSVTNGLKQGTFELCHACRKPLNLKDKISKKYNKGISCPNCYGKISKEKKNALQERNKQIQISKKKGLYNPFVKLTSYDLY